jgi:hypothetical protein
VQGQWLHQTVSSPPHVVPQTGACGLGGVSVAAGLGKIRGVVLLRRRRAASRTDSKERCACGEDSLCKFGTDPGIIGDVRVRGVISGN